MFKSKYLIFSLIFLLHCLTGIAELSTTSNFIFFGDWGKNHNSGQLKVAQGMKDFCQINACDFGLMLGDNFYENGVTSLQDPQFKTKFEDVYLGLKLAFYVVLGNHDYGGDIEAQIQYSQKQKYWKMPARYYTFTQGPAEFFAMDTQELDTDQIDWIKAEIDKSQATWKIVFGHHPMYSNGMHGNTPRLQKHLLATFSDSIDFYLSGHDHDLQLIESDGVSYLVSGTAAEVRPTKKGSNSLFAESTLGFGHLELHEKSSTLSFVDANAKILFKREKPKRKK